MVKILDSLFELNATGNVTRLRGEEVAADSQLLRVLAEHGDAAPPKDTDWALRGAYSFAKRLQSTNEEPGPIE